MIYQSSVVSARWTVIYRYIDNVSISPWKGIKYKYFGDIDQVESDNTGVMSYLDVQIKI